MVLTRSRSGDSRRGQVQQEPTATAGSGASNPAPEYSTSPVAVTDTGSASTATTTTDATQTQGTLKPGDTRSRRSTASRKKHLAELEARERLAEMKVKQAKAERELQEIQLQRIRAEADSSEDDDMEDDLASVRIGKWLARPAPPPGGEARPPPHDVSGGRNDRDAAKDTGAATGAQPLRDDDGYGESVCAKVNKGNIASEVLHGNVNCDKVIDVGTLAAALAQAARSSREPPRYIQQLPVFDGKPGEWIAFKAAYCDSHTYFSCIENVARIRMSLRGAAKEAVGCLLYSQSDPQVILDALERRFGRPEALIMTELDHIKLLPKLNDNPRDICIFASRIANTVGTVEALNRIQYLHSPEMSRCIVEKLTPILRNKWYDYAANRKVEDIPELKRLSMFMNEEADKCGAYAQPERGNDDSNGVRQRRRVERTFNVNRETSNEQCPACKQHGHKLPDCSKYKQLDIDTRWDIAKNSNMCFRCLRNKHRRFMCKAPICDIKECNMKHHKLLHKERKVEATHNIATPPPPPAPTPVITHETVTSARETVSTTLPQNRRAYLKIVPVTLSGPHTSVDTYALLDDGSTVTLLDASVADILGADGPAKPMWIQGIGTEVKHEQSRSVSLHIQGKHHSDPQKIEAARTVNRLEIMAQTVQTEDINNCRHLNDIHSTLVYENARPMILIGQDNWHLLVATETRTGARDQPVASYTKLGWVLHGCQYSVNKVIATFCGHIKTKENMEPIEETMRNFFKLESLGIEPRIPKDDPQQRALDILEQKSRRLPDGSFETGLLWKQEVPKIPNNYLGALKRLENLERRLDKDKNLKTQYLQRLDNLFNSGYAEKAPDTYTINKTWYLPHFPVVNPAKPHKPPRLVHDAAAKTAGLCLNDLLLSGPDLLLSLPGILMRFRQNKIAVSADIKEMFMRIKIREEDRDALRFLWRGDQRNGPPDEYRMTSVIFGATSSPCTALYIKDRNASDFADRYPAAVSAIKNNHYMDDYLQSFPSEEEAKKITTQVDYIHKKANFVLCGWISNNKNVLNNNLAPSQDIKVIGGDDTEKALGLRWDTKEDCFIFRINKNKTPIVLLNNTRPPTKREALSIIMSIFDPLGIISPITTPAKRILQNTWKYKTEWDKPLPEELQPKWKEWMDSLSTIETLLIPRCYDYGDVIAREVHTFVDASEEAYAAAVYWRTERSDGSVQVALAAAKSRVAPLKPVSIPRLELQAALLGARLARTVVQEHDFEVSDLTYWSDSTTALAWIQAEPRTFKTFVAHRIAEIEELTKKNEWRWLPSKDNVADDATRSTPEHFNSEHRWFNGPEFLRKSRDEWPQDKKVIAPMNTGEERVKCHVINDTKVNEHLPNITRFSKWTRLIRTTARVLQFIDLCRPSKHTVEYKSTKKNVSKDPTWKGIHKNKPVKKVMQKITRNKTVNYLPIPATYILRAEEQWVKGAQAESFTKEIAAINDNKAAPGDSPLSVLSTYLDNAGVLRLRGRITVVQDVNEEIKNPIVLEGRHRYTKLYIAYVHESLHHGGTEITVNELRQRVWITRLRPSVKNVLKGCLYCKIKKAKPAKPSTGNLPYPRLAHHVRPFTFTGLDYFGPISVTVGRHKEKRYGALFTCLTCRAIHIEIANSLSADSAIAALRRFIGRRGCPKEIWSDNATCFKAADRELGESALSALGSESNARSISWRYIPPASPFMGGAWERMVRAVKEALYVTLKEVHPSDETLATLLVEVENTVNSRPLTHVNVTPNEPEALTPNHILIGPNSHVPSPGNFTAADVTARHQWRRAQALADVFWRRWVREYLPLLQNRREPYGSGTPPKVGDVVVICDPNLPRNTWPKGRVTKVLPGPDGEVRVVDVMTKGHVLRRPTKRIVVLPTESPDGDGGRNVHDSDIISSGTAAPRLLD